GAPRRDASPWPSAASSGSARGGRVMSPGRAAAHGGGWTCDRACGVGLRVAWRLLLLLGRQDVVDLHPERQAHLGQELLDLVQRLAAEILGLEHLRLGLL